LKGRIVGEKELRFAEEEGVKMNDVTGRKVMF